MDLEASELGFTELVGVIGFIRIVLNDRINKTGRKEKFLQSENKLFDIFMEIFHVLLILYVLSISVLTSPAL